MAVELEAVKRFVKGKFYLIKKSLTKIDNQSESQQTRNLPNFFNNKIKT